LKIFRKTRQSLIDKGKLKAYLVYSVGEILLVVIGILLAVQINNWNQSRIHNKKELQTLKDLEKEFTLNEKRISKKQNSRIFIAPKIKKYINLISSGKANYNSFSDFHEAEFMFGMTNPSNGVIDALISSSDISLISNDSIKYFLAGWKNQLENLYENELILWNAGIEFINSTSNKIPDPRFNWSDWENSSLESASKELIKSVAYRNKLVGYNGCNNIVIEECNAILSEIKKIKLLLKREIKSKE